MKVKTLAALTIIAVSQMAIPAESTPNTTATTLIRPTQALNPLVIYGKDNRMDVFEDADASRRELAESVVAIVPARAIQRGPVDAIVNGSKYGEENNLCKSEKYWEQVAPAYCSGVLVADNIIATAGHCVMDVAFCATANFVFGFNINTQGKDPAKIKSEDVYSCKSILHHEMVGDGADFALVELDRSVVGRKPLRLASAAPKPSEDVFIIGHPVGLPAKIADGATVRRNDNGFYVANLDSFGGNSGSPVFSASTHEVAGLLVRGEQDFKQQGSSRCAVSYHCPDGLCRGEDVTNPDVVKSKLEDILSGGAATEISR